MKAATIVQPSLGIAKAQRGLPLIPLLVFLILYVPFVYEYGVVYAFEKSIDLPSFYLAAELTFQDHVSPYRGPAVPRLMQKKMRDFAQETDQVISPYLYPPPSLLFFYPLTRMSFDNAKRSALVANHLCLLIVLYLLLFKIFDFDLDHQKGLLLVLLIYVFHFHPIIDALSHGQIDLLVLLLLCLTWYAFKKNRHPILMALPLAAAILLKTYPALVVGLFLVKRRFRAAFLTLGIIVVFSVASYALLPNSVWTDWITLILPAGAYSHFPRGLYASAILSNQSINGFTTRLFLASSLIPVPLIPNARAAVLVPYIAASAAGAITLALLHQLTRRVGNKYLNEEFSTVLVLMYLVAPFSWEHHLVFVLPALMLIVCRVIENESNRIPDWLPGSFTLLLALSSPGIRSLPEGVWILAVSAKFYLVFLLWIVCASNMRKESQSHKEHKNALV